MVRKKYSRKELIPAVLGIIFTTAILTVYLWHMTEAVRLGYESGKLESALRQLREEVKKLEAEKASWLSLQKVEQIAREKLGLSEPGEGQIIYDDGPDIY